MTTTCFRSYLQMELADRRARNPRYSLRAFARHLAIDHSTLSQWMRGRRPMTSRTVRALGRRLGLSPKEIHVFVEHRTPEGPDLQILELTHRQDFRADSRWIARELNVSVDEANMALHRLLRFNLLEMAGLNRWIDTSEVR